MDELDAPYIERSQPHERVPSAPLLAFLEDWIAHRDGDSLAALAERSGVRKEVIYEARGDGHIPIKYADALLVGAGQPPDVLRTMYPLPA